MFTWYVLPLLVGAVRLWQRSWRDSSLLPRCSCVAGYYCAAGLALQCPPGRFGATTGLATSLCSGYCAPGRYGASFGAVTGLCDGECAPGHVCDAGSTSATAAVCGDASVYCPGGSSIPTIASTGYYTTGGMSSSTRTGQAICEVGHYCVDGVRAECPAGRYGDSQGLFTARCTAGCPAGYACAAGSVAVGYDTKVQECGSSAVYCPEGSASPRLVDTGYYSSGGVTPQRATNQSQCEPGYVAYGECVPRRQAVSKWPAHMCDACRYYCVAGERALCPSGTYGSDYGLASSACSGPCEAGRFGKLEGQTTPQCEGPCDDGYYCPPGSGSSTQEACAAGFYADVTKPAGNCTLVCPEGHYCPVATSSNTIQQCGSAAFYCPAGSGTPTGVETGYYSTPTNVLASVRTGQEICTAGMCSLALMRYCRWVWCVTFFAARLTVVCVARVVLFCRYRCVVSCGDIRSY